MTTSWRLCAPAAALLLAGSAGAQVLDRVANVEKAAAAIAIIHDKDGSDGAEAAIDACYKRELPKAMTLTPNLEACMAQDIIVAKISAAFYARVGARLSPDQRKKAGVPEPGSVAEAMAKRIYGILSRLNVPIQEAQAFNEIVQNQGMAAYARARFPKEFPEKK